MSEGIEVSECDVVKWGFAKLGVGKLRGMRVKCHERLQCEEKVCKNSASTPFFSPPIYDLSTSLNCIIMLKPIHNDLRRLRGMQLWSTYPCIGHNS